MSSEPESCIAAKKAVTIKRFWAKVDKTPGFGPWGNCWLWTGWHNKRKGVPMHGRFAVEGKDEVASRWILEQSIGPLEKGQMACHKCDVPLCCNPEHLFSGDAVANQQDAKIKGRLWLQKRPQDSHFRKWQPPTRRGSELTQAVLTEQVVFEIRKLKLAGHQYRHIASLLTLSCSLRTIRSACMGYKWKHVPFPTGMAK